MLLQSIIIDDEASARMSLSAFIHKYCPQVQILGEAENINQAATLIKKQKPNLIFLDIEMPGGNAFDLLDRFEQIDFDIIFITAFSDYAVRAFELSAANYLLKPVSIDALVQAIEQVALSHLDNMELKSSRVLIDNLRAPEVQAQKIVLPLLDGFELIRLRDILYISALDNFSQVHVIGNRRITVCRKLKHFDNMLMKSGFYRIHRSHLVNLEYVTRYLKGKGGHVILSNGKELDVAQSRKKDFLEKYGL
jgi:two-component system LytT family response regulator